MRLTLAFLLLAMMAGVAFSAYSASSSYSAFGKAVSLNLAFNITGRTADNLTGANDYVAASSPDVALGITGARTFGTRYDVNYSSDEYIIELRKSLADSRFLLVFTAGNSTVISGRTESVKYRLPARTFGDFNTTPQNEVGIFLRLEYRDVNLLGRVYLGPGSRKLEIKNEGRDDKGVTNVSIGVIS